MTRTHSRSGRLVLGYTPKERRRWIAAGIFVGPAVVLFLLFVAYPVLATLYQGFFSIKLVGGGVQEVFVGLKWFKQALFEDQIFRYATRNSAVWGIWSIFVDIPMAFLLALALHSRVTGWRFFRTAWFVPMLLSHVLIGLIWRWILAWDYGILNMALKWVGAGHLAVDWLGQPGTARIWLMMMTTWSSVGFYMVLILTAFEEIPQELFEAAKIDGAGKWAQVRHILIPLTRRVLATATVITFVAKMKVFDMVWVTTNGGPYGTTETVSTWVIKRAFYYAGPFDLGYPAAMASIWFVVLVVGVWIVNRILRPKDVFEY